MRYLIKKIQTERSNLLSIFTTSALGIFASFVMMLAFANLLNPQTLGVYQYIVAVASVLSTFSLTGMTSAIIRSTSKQHFLFLSEARRYLKIGALFPIVIAAVFSAYYLYKGNEVLGLGIFFSVLLLSITNVILRFNALYIGIEKFKESNYLLKAKALAPLLFVLPALFFINDPSILAILYFGGSLLTIFLIAYGFQMFQKERSLIERAAVIKDSAFEQARYINFAFHQSVVALLNVTTAHFDKILVFQLLGAHATAVYFIAMSVPDRIRGIIKQFEPYLFSKFSKYSLQTTQANLYFKFTLTIIGVIPIFLIYVLITPVFFKTFVPQYTEAITLSMLYSLTLFASASIIPYSHLKAHGSNKLFYYYTFLQTASKTLLLTIGIIFGGLTGAIIGVMIATLLNTIFLLCISLFYRTRQTATIL